MTNIEFEKIPNSLRKPGVYTEYNAKGAVTTLPTNEQEVLIVAPMVGGATAFTQPVRVYSDLDAEQAFGAGSWAHLMTRMAITNNSLIRLSVMGLADSSAGVAASGSLVLTGTATSQGVMTATIAGIDYKVAVATGEKSDAVAARLNAIINGATDCPATSAVNESTITLTAKCKGEIGNEINLTATNTAKDMTINATAFANGAENADLAPALASVAGTHYHIIISPFADEKNAKA